MRPLLLIAVSMALALVIGMGLERAGIVRFRSPVKGVGKNIEVPEPGEKKRERPLASAHSPAVTAQDLSAVQDKNTEGNRTAEDAGSDTLESEQEQQSHVKKSIGAAGSKDTLTTAMEHAVEFLQGDRCANPSGLEGALRKFLKDSGLGEKETSTIVRMAFWKGFVSLQHPGTIPPSSMEQAFAREKELKRAGFRCMGIPLMESEVEAARSRLTEILRSTEGTGAEDGS